MAFWGTEVTPGKPYTHRFDEQKGRLHISQATLGTGSSTKKSILQCTIGDKKPIYLCSFLPEKLETCPLNLEFEEDDEVIFSVVGPHVVHLSGFFLEKLHDDVVGEYDSDSYGEDIADTESDESSDYDSEEGYDDDFIVDDMDMFSRPAAKSGVVIEEIGDDEKPVAQNGASRREKKKKSSSIVDHDNSEHQLVVKGATDPIVESEDDDGFPISSAPIGKVDSPSKKEDKKVNAKNNKIKEKNDSSQSKGLKRKAEVIEDEQTRETDHNSAVENTEVVPESNEKTKKDKKKKKAKTNEEKVSEVGTQGTPIAMDKDKTLVNDSSSTVEKKKKKKKNKKEKETESNKNSEVSVTDKKDSKEDNIEKSETKPYQSRTFPNGLVIDELKMGKPDAKKASPGKKVSVHYIGKLKKNEKIFDSNIGKAPFKFLLGVGQVIKGWDVGVNGMRVGDKRRITIPPAMGYGSKGAGGAIPPNAWLVFDVELVDVR
ncbi:peptidyl-prolyl cis-trans isomerase FKBP53 [Impatiens glandulifera]|uniref:peptidyl-prolyl cis-trans isomerase FKBP53 n=1 Tax=Impatiens glandulifera TaxID=253017 RepID=UPI001FB1795C|nr:peptidyl-prolyl cis-trans isomerase FKBP53 [Impatiens glandulifera]